MENYDYVTAHLSWLKATKNFVPKEADCLTENYYDVMQMVYANSINNPNRQAYARMCFIEDKARHLQHMKVSREVDKIVMKQAGVTGVKEYFVTIGFNHQTWSVADCCKAIEKILSMSWIIKAKANFEYHRDNGLHPHVHFYIYTDEPRSRVLEKLWRPEYIKKLVLSKNFIDIKEAQDYHMSYILLLKSESKLACVEKDKEWRKTNNIVDYEKSWS